MKNSVSKTTVAVLLFTLCLASVSDANAQAMRGAKQPWGYGASVIYNFQVGGLGADLRVKIPLVGKLSAVPEFSYYPSFNDYHEYYAGAALHLELFHIGHYNLYLLGGGYYNNWINYKDFSTETKMHRNIVPEAGGGLVKNQGCIRPFIENRYDIKWKEDNLRIGIYIYPGSCGGRTTKEPCPAFGSIRNSGEAPLQTIN